MRNFNSFFRTLPEAASDTCHEGIFIPKFYLKGLNIEEDLEEASHTISKKIKKHINTLVKRR